MLDTISEAWEWIGLAPAELVATNAFGNAIVKDRGGQYWRIIPEEMSCEIIAKTEPEYEGLVSSDEFQTDWQMSRLVEIAETALGQINEDRCYCLKIPALLGGRYDVENIGTISRLEVIAFAGDLAKQLKDVPDGTEVKLHWD